MAEAPADTPKELTPADILSEIISLNKRIDVTRGRLHEPKETKHIMQNWALSCQLVKHLTRRDFLRKILPTPTPIQGGNQ